jgi:flagellar biosynthesis/type III secretory pathway chaperone
MEKIAGDMSGLLQETLELYQDLKSVLVTEKQFIKEMDVKSLWVSTDRKKRLVQSIEEVISKILTQAKQHAVHLEMTVQNFMVRDVVSVLPLRMKVKSKLKSLGLRIDACKKEIALLAYENKRYLVEYLSVIDGIFSTIRHQASGMDQYAKNGQVYSPGEGTRIINAEV